MSKGLICLTLKPTIPLHFKFNGCWLAGTSIKSANVDDIRGVLLIVPIGPPALLTHIYLWIVDGGSPMIQMRCDGRRKKLETVFSSLCPLGILKMRAFIRLCALFDHISMSNTLYRIVPIPSCYLFIYSRIDRRWSVH